MMYIQSHIDAIANVEREIIPMDKWNFQKECERDAQKACKKFLAKLHRYDNLDLLTLRVIVLTHLRTFEECDKHSRAYKFAKYNMFKSESDFELTPQFLDACLIYYLNS